MTPRVQALEKNLRAQIENPRKMWSAGHLSVLEDPDWRDKPLIVRRAKAIELQLTHMPAQIDPHELIVGKLPLGNFTHGATFPTYATPEEIQAAAHLGIGLRSVWGHYVPNYATIIRGGLRSIRAACREGLDNLHSGTRGPRAEHFYEAVGVAIDGLAKFAKRYETLASAESRREQNADRKAELEQLAAILAKVPENPAETFHEALQSFWLVFATLQATMNNVPIGRFDFYMGPYLQADLDRGAIDLSHAQELIDCLWLKFNERSMFVDPDPNPEGFIVVKQSRLLQRHLGLYNHWLQNVILGGQDPNGADATNSLSYLCLEASRKFKLTQPTVAVRVHEATPSKLVREACRVIQSGAGMPSIYNDPVLIRGLTRYGFPIEKARGYSNDGCWEILVPGETEFRWGPVHALQCLEFVLTNGRSRVFADEDQPSLHLPTEGIKTGDPSAFSSYDEVWQALLAQLDFQIDRYREQSRRLFGRYYQLAPVPFLSSIIDGCLSKGRDITEGGARNYLNAIILTGLPNAMDSLAVLKYLVFEQQLLTMKELLAALECNFEGEENLRQMMINKCPKYGNDNDQVDEIGTAVTDHFADRIAAGGDRYAPVVFIPGVGTFEDYDLFGKIVGATPDGRLAFSPLAPNLSAAPGRDLNGPTALIHSYAKHKHDELAAGAELNISMNSKDFQGEEGLQRLISLVKGFLTTPGTIMNIALNDVGLLKEAQRYPDKHRNLRVRMGGWSAYFVLLDKHNQDHQIARYSR